MTTRERWSVLLTFLVVLCALGALFSRGDQANKDVKVLYLSYGALDHALHEVDVHVWKLDRRVNADYEYHEGRLRHCESLADRYEEQAKQTRDLVQQVNTLVSYHEAYQKATDARILTLDERVARDAKYIKDLEARVTKLEKCIR